MGSVQSSSASADGDPDDDGSAATASHGLGPAAASHLLDARRVVRETLGLGGGGGDGSPPGSAASLLHRASRLVLLNSRLADPCLSHDLSDLDVHLSERAGDQLDLVDVQCARLDAVLSSSPLAAGLGRALLDTVVGPLDDGLYLERASILVGASAGGGSSADLADLACGASLEEEGGRCPARDVVELCHQAARAGHLIVDQEDSFAGGTDVLVEDDDERAAGEAVDSMTASLLASARAGREERRRGARRFGEHAAPDAEEEEASSPYVTREELVEWQRRTLPDLFRCSVSSFVRMILLPPGVSDLRPVRFPTFRSSAEVASGRAASRPRPGEVLPLTSPALGRNHRGGTRGDGPCLPTTVMNPAVFALASVSSSRFGGGWYRLFSGEEDGWTFLALERAILGYGGPTLLIIRAADDETGAAATFGAYTATKWERRRDFYGTPDCFLYQLAPELRVCRPLPRVGTRGGHYMYLHSDTNVASCNPARRDDLPRGLGFGGTLACPRLFVDAGLETVEASHQDSTYEFGHLVPPPPDDPYAPRSRRTHRIESLEVYAVGDVATVIGPGFEERGMRRDVADATLRNARTVDRAAFLGDLREGGKNFAHRGQVDGRAHGYLKGEDGKTNGL